MLTLLILYEFHSKMFRLFQLFLCLLFFSCSLQGEEVPTILVSVAPYKFFAEKIAGSTVTVKMMVPAGASAHTYEPTPKEMMTASRAAVWFFIGEAFEEKAIKALKSHSPSMQVVDLRQGVDLITSYQGCPHCRGRNSEDLHFWLSPKQAAIQVKTIASTLMTLFPQHQTVYQENLNSLIEELHQLDQEISVLLTPLKNRTIMVSHPAYAYFCRDYNLKQLSIEFEGKDPTPMQLTEILKEARQEKIKKIYIQKQYNNKGARLIAYQIGAQVVMLDPYAENYPQSMQMIAHAFAIQ